MRNVVLVENDVLEQEEVIVADHVLNLLVNPVGLIVDVGWVQVPKLLVVAVSFDVQHRFICQSCCYVEHAVFYL